MGGLGGPGSPAGLLVRTTDGGATWTTQTTCTPGKVQDIEALSDSVAYSIVGNRICYTTDAGDTWISQFTAAGALRGMVMVNASLGFAVGINGAIYRTTNGTSWSLLYSETVLTNLVSVDADAAGHVTVAAINSSTGTSDYGSLSSADNGVTWTRSIHTSSAGPDSYGGGGVLQLNATTALVGHRYGVWRTTNSGATWTQVHTGSVIDEPERRPDGTILISGAGSIRRSTDNGATWTIVPNSLSATNLGYDLEATDDNEIWMGGDGDLQARSTDGGTNWSTLAPAKANLQGAAAWDADRWVAVGTSGTVLRTSDGGSTRSTVAVGTSQSLWAVVAAGNGVAVLAGDASTLLRTTDYGATWSPVTSPAVASWRQLTRDDTGRLWVSGTGGNVATSVDDGATWQLLPLLPGTPNVQSLAAWDGTVWVGGSSGGGWRTSIANPTSWTAVSTADPAVVVGIWPIDVQTAVFVTAWDPGTNAAHAYRTTNGGSSWTTQAFPTGDRIYGVHPARDDQRRYAWTTGIAGRSMLSDDGGLTWSANATLASFGNENDIEPIDVNRLVVVGSGWSLGRSAPTASFPDDIPASGSGFGACLASTTGTTSTSWPVTGAGNCTASAPLSAWQPIVAQSSSPGATIASTTTLTAGADLNFGIQVGTGQAAGSYRAAIRFDAIAP
jgi:photosystem II stability/assembly factor-like uncharacterized protein